MLSAQQIICKIKAAYHVETSARNTDGCKCVVVHSKIIEADRLDYGPQQALESGLTGCQTDFPLFRRREAYTLGMHRFSYPSLGSLRASRLAGSQPREYPHVVPFGPLGGGQWTGHAIGLFIVFGFVLMALVGVPESRLFFAMSLGLSAVFGASLYLWHRSKSVF